jgi:PAS domain S-box-containing protein
MDMRALLTPADRPPALALQMAKELLEMTDNAVVLTDRLGLFSDVNAAFERLTGYDRLEVIGRPSNLLASGRHAPEFYRSMWRVLQRGSRWEGEVCDKLRDGSHRWFRLRITPLCDEGGRITHFLGVLGPCASVQSGKPAVHEAARASRYAAVGVLA